jgi:hypothetical protein
MPPAAELDGQAAAAAAGLKGADPSRVTGVESEVYAWRMQAECECESFAAPDCGVREGEGE